MKDQLITFETSKLAKEKGFRSIQPHILILKSKEHYYLWMCELQKWLREIHNIHVCVDISLLKEWYVNIYNIQNKPSEFEQTYELLNEINFKTYEEALEQGLYQALKLIK